MFELVHNLGPWLLLANLAIFAGAAAQTAIGMGLNLFAVPLLALIDPVFVPGPVLLHSLLSTSAASYTLRRDIDWRELKLSIAGLLAGTLIAVLILARVRGEDLPRLFGLLIVLAVAITAAGYRIALTTRGLVTASAAAGVMGTIAGSHGPPIALVYLSESPKRIRCALLPFFSVANGISLVALAAIGRFGFRELMASLVLMPGLLAGYLTAGLLLKLFSPRFVRNAILALSAVSGLALVFKG